MNFKQKKVTLKFLLEFVANNISLLILYVDNILFKFFSQCICIAPLFELLVSMENILSKFPSSFLSLRFQ